MQISNLFLTSVILTAFFCGCTSQLKPTKEPMTISSLKSRHRSATYIALWTLEKNGFSIPMIQFEKPYSDAQPELAKLIDMLEQLPSSKLMQLDKSLKYHRSIYSPIWSPGGEEERWID